MTEKSTWVIHCMWVSDAEIDAGWATSGMQEVKSTSRKGAFAAIRRRLGERLICIDYDNVNEWKPGAFAKLVSQISAGR